MEFCSTLSNQKLSRLRVFFEPLLFGELLSMPVQKVGDLCVDLLFIVRAENDMDRLSRAHL